MIPVTDQIALDEAEIETRFIQASGPGGQNVNKVATACQLRFDAKASPNLPAPVLARLVRLAGQRMTREGVVVITARRHRTQTRNREDALARLVDLLREAAKPPPPKRRATRPSRGAKERRLEEKRQRGDLKRQRRVGPED
ncbi:MAG: alternative ribosome rescue aminoacyl-tRNA hydrolase ArfB [Pseudomonadota bacterium]